MSDPLSALVSSISFSNVETDLVTVGTAIGALYVVYVGVKWVLHFVKGA
jgi:hypothetical protein